MDAPAEHTHDPTVLGYCTTIISSKTITDDLKSILHKIHHLLLMVDAENYEHYFNTMQGANEHNCFGFLQITGKESVETLLAQPHIGIQRVLLTTIYRFSRNLYRVLWKILSVIFTEEKPDKRKQLINQVGQIINIQVLEDHMDYVMLKHGIERYQPSDIFTDFAKYFDSTKCNEFYHMYGYPTIATSISQPDRPNAVDVFTSYQPLFRVPKKDYEKNSYSGVEKAKCSPFHNIEAVFLGTNEFVQFVTGKGLYNIDTESYFYTYFKEFNKTFITGPSCTMQMMMETARYLNGSLYSMFLGCIPWMYIPEDHSLFEMFLTGAPYLQHTEYDPKLHDETTKLGELVGMLPEAAEASEGGSVYLPVRPPVKPRGKPKKSQKGGSLPFAPLLFDDGYSYEGLFNAFTKFNADYEYTTSATKSLDDYILDVKLSEKQVVFTYSEPIQEVLKAHSHCLEKEAISTLIKHSFHPLAAAAVGGSKKKVIIKYRTIIN